jgi:hypothetical protein
VVGPEFKPQCYLKNKVEKNTGLTPPPKSSDTRIPYINWHSCVVFGFSFGVLGIECRALCIEARSLPLVLTPPPPIYFKAFPGYL